MGFADFTIKQKEAAQAAKTTTTTAPKTTTAAPKTTTTKTYTAQLTKQLQAQGALAEQRKQSYTERHQPSVVNSLEQSNQTYDEVIQQLRDELKKIAISQQARDPLMSHFSLENKIQDIKAKESQTQIQRDLTTVESYKNQGLIAVPQDDNTFVFRSPNQQESYLQSREELRSQGKSEKEISDELALYSVAGTLLDVNLENIWGYMSGMPKLLWGNKEEGARDVGSAFLSGAKIYKENYYFTGSGSTEEFAKAALLSPLGVTGITTAASLGIGSGIGALAKALPTVGRAVGLGVAGYAGVTTSYDLGISLKEEGVGGFSKAALLTTPAWVAGSIGYKAGYALAPRTRIEGRTVDLLLGRKYGGFNRQPNVKAIFTEPTTLKSIPDSMGKTVDLGTGRTDYISRPRLVSPTITGYSVEAYFGVKEIGKSPLVDIGKGEPIPPTESGYRAGMKYIVSDYQDASLFTKGFERLERGGLKEYTTKPSPRQLSKVLGVGFGDTLFGEKTIQVPRHRASARDPFLGDNLQRDVIPVSVSMLFPRQVKTRESQETNILQLPARNTRSSSSILTSQGDIDTQRKDDVLISGLRFRSSQRRRPDEQDTFDTLVGQPIYLGMDAGSEQRSEKLSLLGSASAMDLNLMSPSRFETITPSKKDSIIPRSFRLRQRRQDETKEQHYYEPIKTQRPLIKRTTRRRDKGLRADLLSVTQSQARYGTSTQPKLTKQLWKESEKSLFKRVPTKELQKGGNRKGLNLLGNKNKKGGKKNVRYY